MDIVGFAKTHLWMGLLGLYLFSAGQKLISEGWKGLVLTPAGVSLVIALVNIVYNNSRYLQRKIRELKYFFGHGTFAWDMNAKFLVHGFIKLADRAQEIKNIIEQALQDNNVKTRWADDLIVSRDDQGRMNVYVGPLAIHFVIDLTDAEQEDQEGFALSWLSVRARTTVRYKNMKKTIEGFLVDVFAAIDKRYNPDDQKYTVKVRVEGMADNFFKEQFVKEFEPKEIQGFSIRVRTPRSFQEVTESELSITTKRREELVGSISSLLLRMT